MDKAGRKRIYVYEFGGFEFLVHIFFVCIFGFFGLIVSLAVFAAGSLKERFPAILAGPAFLLVSAFSFRRLLKFSRSSQTIALYANKVQLPMTKGEDDSDYLYLSDVLKTEIDNNYDDAGPALIVTTKSKRIAYEKFYFDRGPFFEDFCHRFDSALEAHGIQQPER